MLALCSSRLIYSSVRYLFAFLIAVDTALVDMTESSKSAFAFVLDAVDVQLHRSGDMHLHQICLSSASRG